MSEEREGMETVVAKLALHANCNEVVCSARIASECDYYDERSDVAKLYAALATSEAAREKAEEMVDALAKKADSFEADREYNAGLVVERDRTIADLTTRLEKAEAERDVALKTRDSELSWIADHNCRDEDHASPLDCRSEIRAYANGRLRARLAELEARP